MQSYSLSNIQFTELLLACSKMDDLAEDQKQFLRECEYVKHTVNQVSLVVSAIFSEFDLHTDRLDDLRELVQLVERRSPVNALSQDKQIKLIDELYALKIKKDNSVAFLGRDIVEMVRRTPVIAGMEELLSSILMGAFECDDVDWMIFEWSQYNTALIHDSGAVMHIESIDNFKKYMEERRQHG